MTRKIRSGEYIFDIFFGNKNKTNYIYTLAEAHAIDLIAKTISKCEIQVFAKNNKTNKIEETKNDTYWRLNLQPNYNENGTMFMYKLVTKLLTEQKALVVINKDITNSKMLYVADDFNSSNSILYGKIFSNVVVSDNEGNSITLLKKYDAENSIYYSLKNTELKTASENFNTNINKLLKATQNSFINANTSKWRLKYPGGQPALQDAKTKQPISYEQYKEKITEGLLSEEEAIVLLSEMFDLINLNKDSKKELTDFEILFVRIGSTVAQNWNIPLSVFFGNKTEKSTGNEDFITFGVDQYFELIEDGLNITLVGKKDYLKGEYVKFNRTNISHKDVLDCGTGIDKLTANRFSRNEINKLLKLPNIDEAWANEHALTKNYENTKGGAKENGE